MKQLDVINAMIRLFSKRGLMNHAGGRGVLRYEVDGRTVAFVLDVELSRALLLSNAFEVFDFYADGFRHTGSDAALERVRRFFDESPVCLNGDAHLAAKQALSALQGEICERFEARAPALRALVLRRAERYASPLAFARAFVELCLAEIIADLLAVSLRTALRALRQRRNVFQFYFHRLCHRAAGEAIGTLHRAAGSAFSQAEGRARMLLAESMLLMGSAPLIGSLTAAVMDAVERPGKARQAERYTPVAVVPRLCLRDITIGGERFAAGELCHVSLLPAADQGADPRLAFGAGPHTCIGKRVSLLILNLGIEAAGAAFSGGFQTTPTIAPDGIFLAFRD